MTHILKLVTALFCAMILASCGGGGGSAGTVAGVTPPATGVPLAVPATIEIFSSSAQVQSNANSSVTFTVIVKDASNQAIQNQTVTFAASSGNLLGALPSPKTGAAGEPITTVALQAGSDQSNRNIVVTATAGSVKQTITIPVVGTSLSVSGESAMLVGGVSTFAVRALDSGGRAISGARITLSSALGNNLNPSTVTTDSQGNASFIYTANLAGVETIKASGLGATAQTTLSVSAEDFRFVSPGSNAVIAIGAPQTITVRSVSGGVPAAGRTVNFSTTRGTIAPSSAITDASGQASAVVTSTTSGPANVIAQLSGTQAVLPVSFVATAPASLVLQANPGAVVPNTAGSTANQSSLVATVRDASGNPVSGRIVNFTAVSDGSNGTISPGSGTTDANGQVTAQFIPGALTTPANGVVISAVVQGTSVSGNASLTVNGQALFITIGTGNVITNLDPNTYQKPFSVYVTDANGAPAAGRVVTLSVFPELYGKGQLTYDGAVWVYGTTTFCVNEDSNKDGILNAGEDRNGDGRLTPGLPVVVSPATVTTASNGFASFFLNYGENFAPWLDTTITARATVGGTESVQSQRYSLQGLSADFTDSANPPQGKVSPFGLVQSCTSPN